MPHTLSNELSTLSNELSTRWYVSCIIVSYTAYTVLNGVSTWQEWRRRLSLWEERAVRSGGRDQEELDPRTHAFYRHVLSALHEAGVPFLLGGAYALQHYTGAIRHTKDVDTLVRPRDRDRAFAALHAAGYRVEGVFHWVGKAYCGDDCIDVIWNTTNGLTPIDDGWFEHAVAAEVLGLPVAICPAEELLWVKAFVMERERYDGADVAHLLRACGPKLDWPRLLDRFGAHWRVLLSHLTLFGFIYPDERARIPAWVMHELLRRLSGEMTSQEPADHLCQGPLLSWRQYLPDVEQWGYQDARLAHRTMNVDEIAHWTEAFRDG